MKIYIGSDHAGFTLKQELVKYLQDIGHEVVDKGAPSFEEGDDYPDYIFPVAQAISSEFQGGATTDDVRGIIIGGSGQGEAMVANRLPNVRATVYYGPAHETFLHRIFSQKHYDIIALSREHNNANILSLGARFMSTEQAKKAVNTWLKIPFTGEERHNRRIYKIDHKL